MPAKDKPGEANHDSPLANPGPGPITANRGNPSTSPIITNYPRLPQSQARSPDRLPSDRNRPTVQITHERHSMEGPSPLPRLPLDMDSSLSHVRSRQTVDRYTNPTVSNSQNRLDPAPRSAYSSHTAPYTAHDSSYPGPPSSHGHQNSSSSYHDTYSSHSHHPPMPHSLHPSTASHGSACPQPPRSGGSSHPSSSPNQTNRSPSLREGNHFSDSPNTPAGYQLPSPAVTSSTSGNGSSPNRLPDAIGGRLFTSLTLPIPVPRGSVGPPSDSGQPSAGSTGGHSSVSLSPEFDRHSSSGEEQLYGTAMANVQYRDALLPDVVDAYGQDAGELRARRHRTTPRQFQALTQVYNRTAFPSTQERLQLAERLGMQPRQVQIWFQNRRQQDKNRVSRGVPNPPMMHRNVGRPRVERIPHEGGPEQTRDWVLREARERGPEFPNHYTGYGPPPSEYESPHSGYAPPPVSQSHGRGPPPPSPREYGAPHYRHEGPPPGAYPATSSSSGRYGDSAGDYPQPPNPGRYGPPPPREYRPDYSPQPPRSGGSYSGGHREPDMYGRYVNEEPRRDENGNGGR
ncbi:hypothetical protein DACRYDRAFT_25093 [Dacryopinax primogenitus]|uniref:Homeobox domain-containing protein n=1 Tax=Dacryopinax primogenitus (strain DJM 731) TaxID=1858805 RepID=M5FVC7_DACPD|nr:uncharacterized protein DACRYDRAFT_25093 [Dacryopinax primogenitus]EJT97276.1 hypothetical protein DACRYDRAFT_25093 [Dacryopinax primogenitus]